MAGSVIRPVIIFTWLGVMLICPACFFSKEVKVPDHKTSLFWTTRSAQSGSPSAQSMLGEMYYNGNGVTRDLKKSWAWYKLAAEGGDAASKNMLGIIAAELTKEDLGDAQSIFSGLQNTISPSN